MLSQPKVDCANGDALHCKPRAAAPSLSLCLVLLLVPLQDCCQHSSNLRVRVSNVPPEEDLRCNEAEDLCWCPRKFPEEEDGACSTNDLSLISDVDSALASVADDQEVDTSLCKLAAPALAVPQEDLLELDVSPVRCEHGNLVHDLGEENMVWLHHCGQHLCLRVVLNCMNVCLCEDAVNPEGAIHVEALVDSDLHSQSCFAIEADSMSDLEADSRNVADWINGLLQQARTSRAPKAKRLRGGSLQEDNESQCRPTFLATKTCQPKRKCFDPRLRSETVMTQA